MVRLSKMEYYGFLGVRTDEGWDATAKRLKTIIELFPKTEHLPTIFDGKVNVVIEETMALAMYDQIGLDGGEDLTRELKILHRVEEMWKIGCVLMMESTVEQ